MSGLGTAVLINAVVLAVVLEADLGSHRRITWFRVARPIVTAGFIVPVYLKGFAGSGTGLLLEVAATIAGLLLGLTAARLLTVYRSPRTGKPVTRAGFPYAAVWTLIVVARTTFSYGSVHWFGPQLGHWMVSHLVTSAAVTDSLILMAVAMLITRTTSLGIRASQLPPSTTPVVVPSQTVNA